MSVADCPVVSSRGWPLCPDCGEEVTPLDGHGGCDFTALKCLSEALSQGVTMTDHEKCPRCRSDDLTGFILVNGYQPEAGRTRCDGCGHEWGDGLPDSQADGLPPGFEDCLGCEGTGSAFGYEQSCQACSGEGIVQTVLLG